MLRSHCTLPSQVGRSVGRRDEKLSAASAAAVVVATAGASSGDEERDREFLPNVDVVVQVKVVLSVAESSSSGHSRKFPHKVEGLLRSSPLSHAAYQVQGQNLGESFFAMRTSRCISLCLTHPSLNESESRGGFDVPAVGLRNIPRSELCRAYSIVHLPHLEVARFIL